MASFRFSTDFKIWSLWKLGRTKPSNLLGFYFFIRCNEEGDDFLIHIITGNETWVPHNMPESMEWRHTILPRKQIIWGRKVMCTVVWDKKGFFFVDFLPWGTTGSVASYCTIVRKFRRTHERRTYSVAAYCTIVRKFRRAIQNKRRGMLLLNDNDRWNTADLNDEPITYFSW